MCQCLIMDCWWCNCLGIMCAGIHEALCCCSCWLCKHDELKKMRDDCCVCAECTGYGGALCCTGGICCAPEYVRAWSVKCAEKGTGVDVWSNMIFITISTILICIVLRQMLQLFLQWLCLAFECLFFVSVECLYIFFLCHSPTRVRLFQNTLTQNTPDGDHSISWDANFQISLNF